MTLAQQLQISSFFLSLIFLSLPFVSNAQFRINEINPPASVQISADSLEQMESYFHRIVDKRQIAGIQTAIIRKGELVYFDSYGYSDLEQEKELDEKSIFRIFSMTKPIVSVALMQLYEQGKFKLEDPLYKLKSVSLFVLRTIAFHSSKSISTSH